MIQLRFVVFSVKSLILPRYITTVCTGALLLMLVFAGSGFSQNISRWALGRPALLIDMPGDPGAGGVAWADKPTYSIFPNAWSAEGGGVRVEVAFIDKRRAVIASIQIDPTRTDHQKTTERILRTLKTSLNPIYGWKTYAVGSKGLYVDLPVAPGAPKQQNAVTIYTSDSPLAMTEIRELEVGFPSAHDPDFAAKQYFEMRTSLDSKYKFEIVGIDKLLIDGLEARLVRSTWKNGDNINQRQILIIYGYQTQWIVDMLAAKETAAYMERVMQSVRVKIDFPLNTVRQSIGTMGVSMLVGDKRLESKVTRNANDPDFAREESATAQYGTSLLSVYEMVFKAEALAINDANAKMFIDSFLRGLGQSSNLQITANQRDSFAINIDGIDGRHLIYDITSNNTKSGPVIQADFVILGQDNKLWTAIVITNYEGGLAARYNRAMLLNSLRVGM